jgi:hypothetical protein
MGLIVVVLGAIYAGVMLLAAIGLPGCGKGDPDALSTVPAAGTITFLDKPIAKGTIRLVPDRGRPAGGTIENGPLHPGHV